MPTRATTIALLLICVLGAACYEPNYGAQPFACAAQGRCPEGYQCIDGLCQRPGAPVPDHGTEDGVASDAQDGGGAPDADGPSPPDGPVPDAPVPDGPVPDAPVADGPGPDAPLADGPGPDWNLTPTVVTLRQGASLPIIGTYTGVLDTTLDQSAPDSSSGSWALLQTRNSTSAGLVSLLRFDLSPLPAKAVVTQATVRLWPMAGTAFTGQYAQTMGLFALLRGWDESATWNKTAGGGAGWEVPGAAGATDAEGTALGTAALCHVVGCEMAFSSSTLTSLVADWASGSTANHGVLLKVTSSGGSVGYVSYHSSQAASAAAQQRPTLEIHYLTPP